MALHRLVKAGRLVMPRSGFYVIVDAQHRSVGTLPPEWFIDELMKNMGKQYYVGVLSAAQSHGAAHHRPQEFQVIVPTRVSPRFTRSAHAPLHPGPASAQNDFTSTSSLRTK